MLKLLGLVMIIGSSSAIGISMNKSLRERVGALGSFMTALQLMKAEIVFRALPLEEIMGIIAAQCRGAASRFFHSANQEMERAGQSFWAAVQPCLPQLKKEGLRESDIGHIKSALHALGRYDAHQQSEMITASLIALENQLQSAQADLAQKGKLYRAMGMTAGIALALIIM